MEINENDFKKALVQWFYVIDECLDWSNKEFNDMLDKYGYTLKDIMEVE